MNTVHCGNKWKFCCGMVEHASFIKFHWCSALCLLNFFYILSNFHLDTSVNDNVAEYHKISLLFFITEFM